MQILAGVPYVGTRSILSTGEEPTREANKCYCLYSALYCVRCGGGYPRSPPCLRTRSFSLGELTEQDRNSRGGNQTWDLTMPGHSVALCALLFAVGIALSANSPGRRRNKKNFHSMTRRSARKLPE